MQDFFQNNLLPIAIFYSLGFLTIFFAIVLQRGSTAHFELANTFMYLAGFGLMHGIGDFLVVLPSILVELQSQKETIYLMSKYFNTVSFIFLYVFGLSVLLDKFTIKDKVRWGVFAAPFITVIFFIIARDPFSQVVSSELVYRLFMGLPSGILAALALLKMAKRFDQLKMSRIVVDFRGAAIAFLFYGIFAGLFFVSYPESEIVIGLPIQLLRALAAISIAFFTVRFLAVFKL